MRQCALNDMADAILDACEADAARVRTSPHAA
jgi:hypothetical protein